MYHLKFKKISEGEINAKGNASHTKAKFKLG